ncbi:transcriptional regulatory protein [Apiospora marii]|uniref:transcriptional regulatory protein n=1 Tax=Apiospora marii TaxID=335849 RepID=UPI0031320677
MPTNSLAAQMQWAASMPKLLAAGQDFGADCIYLPPKAMTIHRDNRDHQQKSVQAVEDRVAELESIIRREGISDTHNKRKRCAEYDELTNVLTPVESVESPAVIQWNPSPTPSDSRSDIAPQSFSRQSRVATGTVTEILGDLSAEAPGTFFGVSSQITMGRVISSIIQARKQRVDIPKNTIWEQLTPGPRTTASASSDDAPELPQISAGSAQRLFDYYLRHVATRWPVLPTSFVHLLYTERHSLSDAFFTSVLHMVYAIAGRYLEAAREIGAFFPEQHFAAAMCNLDEVLRLQDIRSVQFLLLLSVYSLRSPGGPEAWTYIGLAMRQCIDLGLHRKPRRAKSFFDHEMKKRVFWTTYCLDRQLSISTGRPFAISDRDIDVEFPLDIDEATEGLEVLEKTYHTFKFPASRISPQPASIAGFLHVCKLRVIESRIYQSMYRVDQSTTADEEEVESFLDEIEGWKTCIPMGIESPYSDVVVSDAYYLRPLHLLRSPFILSGASQISVRRCADACGGVCRTYKKLHQSLPNGFSSIDLRSVFLAGVTLVYCAWALPKEVASINASNDMNACSIVLYIITERLPAARKYRDIYETIKSMALESIETSQYQARRAITKLRPCIQGALLALQSDQFDEQDKLSAMLLDMTGEPAALSEDAPSASAPAERRDADSPALGKSHSGLPLDGIPLDFGKADTYNAMDLELGTIFVAPGKEWAASI